MLSEVVASLGTFCRMGLWHAKTFIAALRYQQRKYYRSVTLSARKYYRSSIYLID